MIFLQKSVSSFVVFPRNFFFICVFFFICGRNNRSDFEIYLLINIIQILKMDSLHDVRDEGDYVYGYLENSQLRVVFGKLSAKLRDVLWYSSQMFQNKR